MIDENVLYEDFETFKENFSQAIKEENFEVQIDMTKKLSVLAEHLGEEITRKELLPFIKENIDFHDEILLNLSEQLKKFIPLVGGYEHSEPVLDLLKRICNTDENVVREKTIETLKCIAEDLNSELTEQLLIPLLEALAAEDWFTSKCSALSLFSIIYPKVKDERKDELRHSFRILAQDDSPIVRKAAAISLLDLIPMMDKEYLKNEFISVFDNISRDNMESVQIHSVALAVSFSRRFSETEIEEFIFKTLETFVDNPSWKIRQILASYIPEIQEVVYFPKFRGKLLAMFQKLIKDFQEDVRIVAVRNLVHYCRSLRTSYEKEGAENNFSAVFLQSIIPQMALLVVDPSVDVKLALTRNILNLSTVISKEIFMEYVIPMVVDILEEESSVTVKAGILENLNDLPRDIDFAQSLTSIKKVVRTLIVCSQTHWRTRRGLLVTFMHIARFASREYFSENLKFFYASLLGDPVFAVRRTAPIILPLLAKQYGINWAAHQLIPYFKMFTKDYRYLYRYVPLFGIHELIRPSVYSGKDIKYLDGLKESKDIQTPTGAKQLHRLKCLIKKLSSKLKEKNFEDILSLNKSINDFKIDNVKSYAGKTITSLQEHYTLDIFSYSSADCENYNEWYLTGLVSLIYRDFLDLILFLFEDKIVNVQIRSIFSLNQINVFTENLSQELEASWVTDVIQLLSSEECENIEKDVELELIEKFIEIEEEKIDTELMENMLTVSENSVNVTEDIDTPEINIEDIDNIRIEEIAENEVRVEEETNDNSEKIEDSIKLTTEEQKSSKEAENFDKTDKEPEANIETDNK